MERGRRNAFLGIWVLAIVGTQSSFGAQEQYPSRQVRIIVPTAPGGGNDLVARMFAQAFSERFGRPVIAENRTGAGTMIGNDLVAKSKADGHTLLMAPAALAIIPALYKNVPYDTEKDFAAITHVAYKGTTPGLTDLLTGQIALMAGNMPQLLPHVRAGRLRALGVTTANRSPAAPEIPTVAESGLPGYESPQWYGFFAPAGTPRGIIDRLNAAALAVLRQPENRRRLAATGAEIVASTPDKSAAFFTAEIRKWSKVAGEAGIRLQ